MLLKCLTCWISITYSQNASSCVSPRAYAYSSCNGENLKLHVSIFRHGDVLGTCWSISMLWKTGLGLSREVQILYIFLVFFFSWFIWMHFIFCTLCNFFYFLTICLLTLVFGFLGKGKRESWWVSSLKREDNVLSHLELFLRSQAAEATWFPACGTLGWKHWRYSISQVTADRVPQGM